MRYVGYPTWRVFIPVFIDRRLAMPLTRHEFEGTPLFFVPSSAAGLPVNELGHEKESIVAETPTTSTTLLRDIASGAENARWCESFSRLKLAGLNFSVNGNHETQAGISPSILAA